MTYNAMNNVYVADEYVDIYKYPHLDQKHLAQKETEITVGDLHANSAKLLYTLVRHGFVNMAEKDYDEFVKLYKKSIEIKGCYDKSGRFIGEEKKLPFTKSDFNKFNKIIKNIDINSRSEGSILRLIGDELSDRGGSDYFTLKILEKLEGKINVEILMSNHSADFLNQQEGGYRFTDIAGAGASASALGLQYMIDRGWVERETIDEIVSNAYKPTLKAIGYSLSEDKKHITVHTHAPTDLAIIKDVSNLLGVEYRGDNAELLAQTIDTINDKLTENYVNNNTLHTLLTRQRDDGVLEEDIGSFPFLKLLWNRSYRSLDQKYGDEDGKHVDIVLDRSDSFVSFCHGHDPNDPDVFHGNIINLDNGLGKTDRKDHVKHNNEGLYDAVFFDKNAPSPDATVDVDSVNNLVGSIEVFYQKAMREFGENNQENKEFEKYFQIAGRKEEDIIKNKEKINEFITKLSELKSNEKGGADKLNALIELLVQTNISASEKNKPCEFMEISIEKIIKSHIEKIANGEKIEQAIEFSWKLEDAKINKDKMDGLKSTQSDISAEKSQKNGIKSSFLEAIALVKNKINERKNPKITTQQAAINDLVSLATGEINEAHQEQLIMDLNTVLSMNGYQKEDVKGVFNALGLEEYTKEKDFLDNVQKILNIHNVQSPSPNSEITASNVIEEFTDSGSLASIQEVINLNNQTLSPNSESTVSNVGGYDQPNSQVQSDNQSVKQPKISLEKIKSMFNFLEKIEARNQQKEEAKNLVANAFKIDNYDLMALLKSQEYSKDKRQSHRGGFSKILDAYSNREQQIQKLVSQLKDDVNSGKINGTDLNKNKSLKNFVKQEIRKVEKEVKKSSEKTTQAKINFIGNKTSDYIKEIASSDGGSTLKRLAEIQKDIKNDIDTYQKLTKNDAGKRNEVIEMNLRDLDASIANRIEKPATAKSENTSKQSERKKAPIVNCYDSVKANVQAIFKTKSHDPTPVSGNKIKNRKKIN